MTTRLVKHQKLTKRQIKEDPLVTMAFRGAALWEKHGVRILAGLGALVVVVLAAVYMNRSHQRAEERAAGDLLRANVALSQGDAGASMPMFKEIIDNAPGTRAAREALLTTADLHVSQGKPGDAIPLYRKYIDRVGGDRNLKEAGQQGLAVALEDHGEFAPAAAAYGDLAKDAATDNVRGRAMLSQARCLARAGQTSKGIEVYRAILVLPMAEEAILNAAGVRLSELETATSR